MAIKKTFFFLILFSISLFAYVNLNEQIYQDNECVTFECSEAKRMIKIRELGIFY